MGHEENVFVEWIMPVYRDRNDWRSFERGGGLGLRES